MLFRHCNARFMYINRWLIFMMISSNSTRQFNCSKGGLSTLKIEQADYPINVVIFDLLPFSNK